MSQENSNNSKGFTLVELSIVLVIIGLIAGGILVGRDLINAATVRSQISQIEKYQQAVNTFRGKYGYLPGDIPNPDAINFGFVARGAGTGQGNGNGVVEANVCIQACPFVAEEAMFWVDLSTAKLVDGSFTTATPTASAPTVSGSGIIKYMPASKTNGYVYVWSNGYGAQSSKPDGKNYFSVTGVTGSAVGGSTREVPILTVSQAYNIDKKIDDGLPQFGNVLALSGQSNLWASGGAYMTSGGIPYEPYSGDADGSAGPVKTGSGVATAPDVITCYDNNNVTDATEQYSVTTNNGSGLNCWISTKFQ